MPITLEQRTPLGRASGFGTKVGLDGTDGSRKKAAISRTASSGLLKT